MLDEISRDVRSISHQIMPRALEEVGLQSALSEMIDKSLRFGDLNVSFDHHNVEGKRFDPKVELSLYRIAQEILNNLLKHANAKNVSIQLNYLNKKLILVVEDDGTGFDPNSMSTEDGIGMRNIKSRATTINGEVNFESSPNKGTIALIKIPIDEQNIKNSAG